LSDICLSHTSGLSREQRAERGLYGDQNWHTSVTRDSIAHYFQGQRSRSPGRFTHRGLNGRRLSMHSFSKNVGIGSSRQDFVDDSVTTRRTSSAEQGYNDDSVAPVTPDDSCWCMSRAGSNSLYFVSEELQKRVGGVRCGVQRGVVVLTSEKLHATSTATAMLGWHCRVK